MPNEAHPPHDGGLAPRIMLALSKDGRWIRYVREADGTERPLTTQKEADARLADQRFPDHMAPQTRESIQQCLREMAVDPSFRSDPTNPRYAQYAAWKAGCDPDYAPTIVDRAWLAAENARQTYGPLSPHPETTNPEPTAGAGEVAGEGGRLPVWDRLRIVQNAQGDGVVWLDGKDYRVPSDAALKLLKALQDRKGDAVLGRILGDTIDDRPDHVWDKLPKPLQRIIEKPGRGRKGYRLKG